MARTPKAITPPADEPALNTHALAQANAAPAQLAVAQEAMDEVLAAGIDLGRLEAMDFIATVANSASVQIFENVKKSKAWRLLRNPKSCDGRNFESLDEFCDVKFGKSYRRLQELSSAKTALGQDAFEQAERLGLRQKDYNAIKSLPAPDQELVRRAVEETQSRDEVLDLLQELAARHAKEKEDLKQALQDTRDQVEDLAASKRLVEGMVSDLRKQARQLAQATPDELAAHLRKQAEDEAKLVEAKIRGPLCEAFELLMTHGEETGHTERAWVQGQLTLIMDRVKTVAGRMGIELQADAGKPAWLVGATIPSAGVGQ